MVPNTCLFSSAKTPAFLLGRATSCLPHGWRPALSCCTHHPQAAEEPRAQSQHVASPEADRQRALPVPRRGSCTSFPACLRHRNRPPPASCKSQFNNPGAVLGLQGRRESYSRPLVLLLLSPHRGQSGGLRKTGGAAGAQKEGDLFTQELKMLFQAEPDGQEDLVAQPMLQLECPIMTRTVAQRTLGEE